MNLRTSDERNTYAVERFVGRKTGLVQRVEFTMRHRDVGDVIVARVAASTDPEALGVTDVNSDLLAVGKGATTHESLRSVVGEYVERYCAFSGFPHSDRANASYESLRARGSVIPDFDTITHYTDEQYLGIDAKPLAPDDVVTWVEGTELTTGSSMLLPSWLASSRIESPHGFGSSNGCAAGQSLSGATYRALLEVVERDALMRCWYRGDAPKRVRLQTRPALARLRDRCEPAYGQIELLALETDLPFEVISAVLIGTGDSRPKFLIGASARRRFEDSVTDALHELSQQIQVYRRLTIDNDSDPDDERLGIGDNGLHYADPKNFEAVEWLLSGDTESPPPPDEPSPTDVTTRVETALAEFDRASMNVVLYDMTTPDVADAGLCAVKVVVPDLVPLCHPERPAAGHDRLPTSAVRRDPHPIP